MEEGQQQFCCFSKRSHHRIALRLAFALKLIEGILNFIKVFWTEIVSMLALRERRCTGHAHDAVYSEFSCGLFRRESQASAKQGRKVVHANPASAAPLL